MKAIVIGGGIGGLTTAISLLKKGIDASVFEAAPEIREAGAGIWAAPNAMEVFERLGIAESIRQEGVPLKEICVADVNGKKINSIDGDKIKAAYGNTTISIHRAALQQVLMKNLPPGKVFTGKRFIRFENSPEKICAFFDDGTHAEGDVLLAADGIHSVARKQMFGEIPMRYSGQTCWRFTADFRLPEFYQKKMFEFWGNEKGLRAGMAEIGHGKAYLYITCFTDAGGKDEMPALKNRLKDICRVFPPVVNELIDAAKADHIIRTDLSDFAPVKSWTKERVALIGDAAHATTPNLGQGGCQAIESAYVAAGCLSENKNIPEALKQYEKIRMKKAHFITSTSWNYSKMSNIESAFMRNALKIAMKYSPQFIQEAQFHKIYSLNF